MIEDMVVVPDPEPELVIVPPLFAEVIANPPVLLALRVRFWLPIMVPIVHSPDPVELKVFLFASRVTTLVIVRSDAPVWDIPVTLVPIAEDMVVVPLPDPELAKLPVLLRGLV